MNTKDTDILINLIYSQGKSCTYASFSNEGGQMEVSGMAGNRRHYLSILPTIVRTFWPAFLSGALIKVVHDIFQFLNPQILRYVVTVYDYYCNNSYVSII